MNNKLNLQQWKEIIKFLKPYKKRITLMLFFSILTGVLEALYPLFLKYSLDNFVEENSLMHIEKFILVYALFTVVLVVLVYQFVWQSGILESKIRRDLRIKAYKNLQGLSISYYDNIKAGSIIAILGNSIYQFSEIVSWSITNIFYGISLVLFFLIAMFSLSPQLTLVSIVTIPIIAYISRKFQLKMIEIKRGVRDKNAEITSAYSEDIQGIDTTKTLVLEDSNYNNFIDITEKYRLVSLKSVLLNAFYIPSLIAIGAFATSVVIAKGGGMINMGLLSVGTFSAMITYSLRFYDPIRMMGGIFSDLLSAQASSEKIFGLINEKPKVKDLDEVIKKYGINPNREDLPPIKGEIEFRNVSFSYVEGEEILKDFAPIRNRRL